MYPEFSFDVQFQSTSGSSRHGRVDDDDGSYYVMISLCRVVTLIHLPRQ